MAQRLIPGVGYVDEKSTASRLIPGAGYVTEALASGGGDHNLVGAATSQSATSSTASATQSHVLGGAPASQANTSATGTITQTHQLADAPTSQGNTSGTGAIQQTHTLAGAASVQENSSSTAVLGEQPHVLAGSTSSQANTSTSGAIVQQHSLAGGTTDQSATSSAAAITQHHALVGANSTQANQSSTGSTAPPEEVPDVRYARPASTISAGPWLPSSGSDLAAMIDEPSADSADYIYTESAGAVEIKLAAVEDPGTSSNQVLRYQIWSLTSSGGVMRLKQGATVIAMWLHASLPTVPTIYAQTLTSAECDSITDYTDLRFEFTAV